MADTGIKDINRAFNALERSGQLRTLRRTLNASLTPMVKALRAAAPQGTRPHRSYKGRTLPPGFLSRSVVKSTRITRDRSSVVGSVRLKSEAWYGSLLNHGWRPGKRSKEVKKASKKGGLSEARLSELGDNRRKIQGNQWFDKAVARTEDEVGDTYLQKIGGQIEKEFYR